MPTEFFDPTYSPPSDGISYVPRPERLDGLRIGLVDNGKHNAGPILKKLAERLAERYGMKLVQVSGKQSPAHGVTEETAAALKSKADFVIAGVGD